MKRQAVEGGEGCFLNVKCLPALFLLHIHIHIAKYCFWMNKHLPISGLWNFKFKHFCLLITDVDPSFHHNVPPFLNFLSQESIKSIVRSGEREALVSKNVLHICVEAGLRLLSPFMPFLSEELFQRLSRRPQVDEPSICLAPYPTSEEVIILLMSLTKWFSIMPFHFVL